MTTERYDIVVSDKVEESIDEKFSRIAEAARNAHKSISDLQQSLAKISSRNAETVSNRMALAAARQQIQQQKLAESAARTAVAQQRLATQTQRTIAAQAQADAAISRSAVTQEKAKTAVLSTATAQQKLATETQKAATASAYAQVAAQKVVEANTRVQASLASLSAAQVRAAEATQRAAAAATVNANNIAAAQTRAAVSAQKLSTEQARTAQATTGAATAQQKLSAAAAQAASAQTRQTTATTQQATAVQRLAYQTAQASAAQDRAALTAIRLANARERAARNGNYITDGLQRFAIRALAAAAAWQVLTGAFSKAETFTNLQNKLGLVADSQAKLVALTDELLNAANRARSPLEASATTFQRIDFAIRQVGGSQRESLRITEALTKSIAANGLASSEQASALLQVSQAFNKGRLDGDEFRSVMENFPALGHAIAKSMGFANDGLLFEASKQGKINLDVLRSAVELLGDSADKQLAKSTLTVDQAFRQLTNSSVILIGRLDQQFGVTASLAKTIEELALATQRYSLIASESGKPTLSTQQQLLKLAEDEVDLLQERISKGETVFFGEMRLAAAVARRANALREVKKLQGDLNQTPASAKEYDDSGRFANQQSNSLAVAAERERKRQAAIEAAKNAARGRRTLAQMIEEEIQRLREKTEVLGDVTELQRLESQIIAGRYKAASSGQIDELYNLARQRDAEKELIQQQQARLASAEQSRRQRLQDIAALEQEARALFESNQEAEIELENLNATAYSMAVVQKARLDSLAMSKELQADSIKRREGITAETAALESQAAELRKRGQLGVQGTEQQFVNQQSGLSDPSALLEGTQVALQRQLAIYQQYYAQIDELEKNRTLTVQEAATARLRVDNQAEQARLKNTTIFLDNLATLQSSKSKTLAKVGKAAAVARAIVDTYASANAAYAAMAGIPVVGPALGVAAAGAAIAAGMANVQAIRAQGYRDGGYTGDVPTNSVAGVVHGQEYVVNAAATKRNRQTLEAMNRGANLDTGRMPSIVVHNMGTPQTYETVSVTRDEVRLIARDQAESVVSARTPALVASQLSDSNSPVSKALSRNTDARRKR